MGLRGGIRLWGKMGGEASPPPPISSPLPVQYQWVGVGG